MSRMKDRNPKVTRRRFLTAGLSDEEAEQIAATRMDKRHDHLDAALLDDEPQSGEAEKPQ
jgi:hypothetical protein